MEDPYDASSSQTETSADEPAGCSVCSKNTKSSCSICSQDENQNQHSSDTLKTKAMEVNSADEVRQAIKAVLSGKTPLQSEGTDPVHPTNTASEEIQVSMPHEYKPESGDQILVPKQDKSRKRRGRPQKAGPSKRVKRATVEDFYLGKLSNVVQFPNYSNQRYSESDSEASIYAPYAPNQWLRMRFYK